MEIPSYFTDFIREISPSKGDRSEYQKRHITLCEQLKGDEDLKDLIVSTFLQGLLSLVVIGADRVAPGAYLGDDNVGLLCRGGIGFEDVITCIGADGTISRPIA